MRALSLSLKGTDTGIFGGTEQTGTGKVRVQARREKSESVGKEPFGEKREKGLKEIQGDIKNLVIQSHVYVCVHAHSPEAQIH